jgi:hypothetical protein
MIQVRRSEDRGHFDHGWLDTWHTFSFAGYRDSAHMGFGSLRVMNEDRIRPGAGFGMHGHRDMEILSYVLEGRLEHRDSMGNGAVLGAGSFQRMTAGTGVEHSEFNPSREEPVHLYQIWIRPRTRGLTPEYEEWTYENGLEQNRLLLVASGDGRDGAMKIHQDADVYVVRLEPGRVLQHTIGNPRRVWLQVIRGSVQVDQEELAAGDGAAIHDEAMLSLMAQAGSEVMLFDMA